MWFLVFFDKRYRNEYKRLCIYRHNGSEDILGNLEGSIINFDIRSGIFWGDLNRLHSGASDLLFDLIRPDYFFNKNVQNDYLEDTKYELDICKTLKNGTRKHQGGLQTFPRQENG